MGQPSFPCIGKLAVPARVSGNRTVETYSMQAAENWFEDIGSGRLEKGSAVVRFDDTFADTLNAGVEYHVFLTPKGDCKGLYVTGKTAGGFTVHELGGGKSTIAFDWRIVAKRKGMESLRLRDITEEARRNLQSPCARRDPARLKRAEAASAERERVSGGDSAADG
jgi:hypothetical protein